MFVQRVKRGIPNQWIRWLLCLGLINWGGWNFPLKSLALPTPARVAPTTPNLAEDCPVAALARLKRYRLKTGDTLAKLAQTYRLDPETLLHFNPQLKNKSLPMGKEIIIPPFNGIRIEVPQGATWRDVAKAYGMRADLLFEVNGCQENPRIVFIPGLNRRPTTSMLDNYTGLNYYPLLALVKIGLDFGWQGDNIQKPKFFHSGVDLVAPAGTPVVAAASGTVLLVSQEGPYGFLVIIDHGNDRQTRYAHLERFGVEMGQKVQAGDIVGYVGTSGRPDIPESHLHFEVRFRSSVGWVAQDPKAHLPLASKTPPTSSRRSSSSPAIQGTPAQP